LRLAHKHFGRKDVKTKPAQAQKTDSAKHVADYPKKLYYRINEAGKITGVKPYVLRYWESEFKELRPEKDAKSQRRYRQEDIDLILKIKELLYERQFTIAGARAQLRLEIRGAKSRVHGSSEPKPASSKKRDILSQVHELKKDLTKICETLG
jgi:DNA-binding transcriptional MerR regulator